MQDLIPNALLKTDERINIRKRHRGRTDLSVVIPTRNAGSAFRQVMSAVELQEFDGSVEYVIVDSGSVDGTDAAAAARGWRVIHIPQSQFNHGRTRNLGIDQSCGRYVVLMTQDALPGNKYLFLNLIAPFTDPCIAGVCARQVPRADADPILRHQMALWPATSNLPHMTSASTSEELKGMRPHEQYLDCRFDNVCSAVRRAVWTRHPFPEIDFGEDLAWGVEAVRSGWKIFYQPEAFVLHSHNRSPLYDYRRAYCFAWQIEDLFGIHHLPTSNIAVRLAVKRIWGDTRFLSRYPLSPSEKLLVGMRSTLRTVAEIAGQYFGARDRQRNVKRIWKQI